jgi:hypothetical protein
MQSGNKTDNRPTHLDSTALNRHLYLNLMACAQAPPARSADISAVVLASRAAKVRII